MIYKKKLHKRPPIKRLIQLFYDEQTTIRDLFKNVNQSDWIQRGNSDDETVSLLAEVLGIAPKKIQNCIMHVITHDIDPHRDEMSKGVYLLPLRFTKTQIFYDEDRDITFEKGFSYKFNDFLSHGIVNERCANLLLISVDT